MANVTINGQNYTGIEEVLLQITNGGGSEQRFVLPPILQEKTVTPAATTQQIVPGGGYSGLSKVTVYGDANLIAANIKNGVRIFGITGTYTGSGTRQQTDSTAARVKTVPNGAVSPATITKIGGKSQIVNGMLKHAAVTSVVSSTGGSITVNSDGLTAYGAGVGSVYNELNISTGKYIQRVGVVTLNGTSEETGGAAWYKSNSYPGGYYLDNWLSSHNGKADSVNHIQTNGFVTVSTTQDYIVGTCLFNTAISFRMDSSQYPTLASFKAYLAAHPITVCFELNTPVETGISMSGSISVASGGTLTFTNAAGLDMPNEVVYQVTI